MQQQYLLQHQQMVQHFQQEERNDVPSHNNSLEDIDEDIDITDEDDQTNPIDLSVGPRRAPGDFSVAGLVGASWTENRQHWR